MNSSSDWIAIVGNKIEKDRVLEFSLCENRKQARTTNTVSWICKRVRETKTNLNGKWFVQWICWTSLKNAIVWWRAKLMLFCRRINIGGVFHMNKIELIPVSHIHVARPFEMISSAFYVLEWFGVFVVFCTFWGFKMLKIVMPKACLTTKWEEKRTEHRVNFKIYAICDFILLGTQKHTLSHTKIIESIFTRAQN